MEGVRFEEDLNCAEAEMTRLASNLRTKIRIVRRSDRDGIEAKADLCILRLNLKRLQERIGRLHQINEISLEVAQLQAQTRVLEQEEREQGRLDAQRRSRGNLCSCKLREADAKHVRQNWHGCVHHVAIDSLGHAMIVAESGKFSYSGDASKLANYFSSSRSSRSVQRVSFAAFGSHNRHYVKLADGTSRYFGSKAFEDVVGQRTPQKVAFGKGFESFFVLFTDGSTVWRDLPTALHCELIANKISHAKALPKVGIEEITLGQSGEYFLRFSNCRWKCCGHSHYCQKAIERLRKEGCSIRSIAFGANGSWLIRYC
jgi:hypothetical protein